MRKMFAEVLLEEMEKNNRFILLTADMGYGILDSIRKKFPNRFYNVGAAEQLMIGVAAGMAMEGFIPVCYSITPFLLYRPFEFIRNFMNNDRLTIKLIGGGRDKDYGYLGSTHWASEDMEVLAPLKNINSHKPCVEGEYLRNYMISILSEPGPSYLNLKK